MASAGGNLFTSVSSDGITIWKAKAEASSPVRVIPAPQGVSIASSALSPSGNVLALLLRKDHANTNSVISLCEPETAAPLLRLELPAAAWEGGQPLLWVSSACADSLLVVLQDSSFFLLDFLPEYRGVKSKKVLHLKNSFGRPLRALPVLCGQDSVALVLLYANAVAVYSLPAGEPLIVKDGVAVKAVVKIVQTSGGYALLGLIERFSLKSSRAHGDHADKPKRLSLEVSPTGLHSIESSLVWVFIGNRGCKAIALCLKLRDEQIRGFDVFGTKSTQVATFTSAGRVLFLDPFRSGGPLLEYRLPRVCRGDLTEVSIATSCESAVPESGFVLFSHSSQDARHGTGLHPHFHVISSRDKPDPPVLLKLRLKPASPPGAERPTSAESIPLRLALNFSAHQRLKSSASRDSHQPSCGMEA